MTPSFVTDAELKARRHQRDAAQGPTALFVEGRMTDFGGGRNPVGVSEMGDIPVHHTRPPHAHTKRLGGGALNWELIDLRFYCGK